MKRRQSSAHRNVHSGLARNQQAAAWNRGLESTKPAPEPYRIDMEAFIAGLPFADPLDLVEVRRALEHYAQNNGIGYFLKSAVERIIEAPNRYAEEQRQAEQNAA